MDELKKEYKNVRVVVGYFLKGIKTYFGVIEEETENFIIMKLDDSRESQLYLNKKFISKISINDRLDDVGAKYRTDHNDGVHYNE
jgi:hypothetical protein